jgi:hypothetical protein
VFSPVSSLQEELWPGQIKKQYVVTISNTESKYTALSKVVSKASLYIGFNDQLNNASS